VYLYEYLFLNKVFEKVVGTQDMAKLVRILFQSDSPVTAYFFFLVFLSLISLLVSFLK